MDIISMLIAMLPSLIISLVSSVLGIVLYVMMSWGMYSISKRRGISKPWLAWIPYGQNWILGAISDHYQLAAKGKETSRRKVLLGLSLGVMAAAAVVIAGYVVLIVVAAGQLIVPVSDAASSADSSMVIMVLILLGMIFFLLLEVAIAVVYSVFTYIALFDLFRSCNPDTGVLFLILSIVLGINGFFVFLDRNKDFGMPVMDDGFEVLEPAE